MIIATRARVSISVNPSPIWCSVRLPLDPLDFVGLWAQYVSAESRERETRLRNLKVRVRERKYTFIILLLLALLLSTFSASAVGIIRQIRQYVRRYVRNQTRVK